MESGTAGTLNTRIEKARVGRFGKRMAALAVVVVGVLGAGGVAQAQVAMPLSIDSIVINGANLVVTGQVSCTVAGEQIRIVSHIYQRPGKRVEVKIEIVCDPMVNEFQATIANPGFVAGTASAQTTATARSADGLKVVNRVGRTQGGILVD